MWIDEIELARFNHIDPHLMICGLFNQIDRSDCSIRQMKADCRRDTCSAQRVLQICG